MCYEQFLPTPLPHPSNSQIKICVQRYMYIELQEKNKKAATPYSRSLFVLLKPKGSV